MFKSPRIKINNFTHVKTFSHSINFSNIISPLLKIMLSLKHFSFTKRSINLFKNNLNFRTMRFSSIKDIFNHIVSITKSISKLHKTVNYKRVSRIFLKININYITKCTLNLSISTNFINSSTNIFNSIFSFFIFSSNIEIKNSINTITKSQGIKKNTSNITKFFSKLSKSFICFRSAKVIIIITNFISINIIKNSISSRLIISCRSSIYVSTMFSKATAIVSINTTTFYITNKFISNSTIIFTCIISYLSNNSRRRAVYLNPSTGQPSVNTGSIDSIGFNVINFNSSSLSNIIINSFF